MKIRDIFTTKYGEWRVYYSIGYGDWTPFKGIKGYWYADPTLIKRNGVIYLFTEAFQNNSQIGRIAVSKLENGAFSRPKIVIKKPYHLSYPCVFEYKDKVYMLPESSQNRTLELYCAEDENLLEWRLVTIIRENVNCVDTTVFIKESDVYLITYFQRNGKYTTVVYRLNMDDFVLTEVFSKSENENISRPAGKVYENCGYFRPVQYNKNCYGEKMRILKFDPEKNDWMGEEYKQISVADLNIESIKRTHTLNLVDNVKVIDGLIEYRTILTPYYVIKRKIHNLRFRIRNARRKSR